LSKPDPRHAFTPRNCAKALDLLVDALKKRVGIAVMTGENGVGKSTTLRKFVLQQREAGHAIFMPDEPALSMDTLLEAVCEDAGIKAAGSDRLSYLYALREHLDLRLKSGDVCAIIADNGAGAPDAMLRDLGLLADLERNSPRPIQIVLAGSSRLIDRLNAPDFNTVRKEVGAVIKLEPFERDETGAYLQHCLTTAGYRGPSLFSFAAIERIHSKTRGVPRAINQVAVSALGALKTSGGKLSPEAIDIAVAEALAAPGADEPAPAPIVAPPAPVVQTLPVPAPPPSEIVVTPVGGGLMSQPQTMTVRMMLDKLDREFATAEIVAKPAVEAPAPEEIAAPAPPPAAPRADIDRVIADAADAMAAPEPAPPSVATAQPAPSEIRAMQADTTPQAADPAEKPTPSAADLVADALAQVDAEEAQNTVREAPAPAAAPRAPAPMPMRPAMPAPHETDTKPHNSVRQRLLSRLTGR
jgi:type II secretory pathway predicted ATPase ExeA